jgi:hypothetical protein
MGDAEEIRTQLFGLLGKGEATARLMTNLQFQVDAPSAQSGAVGATAAGNPVAVTQLVQDPKMAEKLKELEKKLAEQTNALDSVLNEKMKLEEELANAKTDSGGDGQPADKAAVDRAAPLQERVKQLEAQLAEYAIIEDDLANLKRLQKENKTLKQQIADGGGAPAPAAAAPEAPKAAAKPATPAPAVPELEAAPAPAAEPAEARAAPAAPVLPDPTGPNDPDIATETVDASHPHDPDHPADFESLVDVVEKNLADAAKSENVDSSAAPAAPEFSLESGPAVEMKPDEKSEEQLQADFEKMLNS